MSDIKLHQQKVLLFTIGLFIGACLHYFFNTKNMEYVHTKAYKEGVEDTRREIIQGILNADTTLVTESEIEFIYK